MVHEGLGVYNSIHIFTCEIGISLYINDMGGVQLIILHLDKGGEGASKIYVPFLCGPPEKQP